MPSLLPKYPTGFYGNQEIEIHAMDACIAFAVEMSIIYPIYIACHTECI